MEEMLLFPLKRIFFQLKLESSEKRLKTTKRKKDKNFFEKHFYFFYETKLKQQKNQSQEKN